MGFRDDREALRSRLDSLESDISRTQAELGRAEAALEQHESKDLQDERELRRLRKEVARLKRLAGKEGADASEGKKRGTKIALLAALVLLVVAVVGFYLAASSERVSPLLPGIAIESSKVEGAERASALPPQPPPAPIPLPEGQDTHGLLFAGEILEAEGMRAGVGEACLLSFSAYEGPGSTEAKITGATLRCGEETIFESRAGDESFVLGSDASLETRRARRVGERRLRLRLSLHEPESGLRLFVDSEARKLELHRREPSALRLLLHLGHASTPTIHTSEETRAVFENRAPMRALHTLARRTSTAGVAPAGLGGMQSCELLLDPYLPTQSLFNCRAVLRCGGVIAYGAEGSGYNECTVEEGLATLAMDTSDQDGDPVFVHRWAERRVEISGHRGSGEAYALSYELVEPDASLLEGAWQGIEFDAEGGEIPVWLLLEDGQATLERGAPGGGEGPRRLRGNAMMAPGAGLITLALRAEAETEAGARAETGSETGSEAEAGAGEIVYELQFGPGFGSLLGVRIPAAGRSAEETRSLGLMRASPSRR